MTWNVGDRLTHRLNPELGVGQVLAIEGRFLIVTFSDGSGVMRLAPDAGALEPLVFRPGQPVELIDSGERGTVAETLDQGRILLRDGRQVEEDDLVPVASSSELMGRLLAGEVDRLAAFDVRLDALRLESIRQADGLGSFLGGRIRLFPHQLYVAERASRSGDPVRWLLADEVGLGKTVESCLILDHLLRTGRAERTLVVAPETLTVQWLGELWRKYHQVFVLLDDKRLKDVEKDYGKGFNPFDAYPQVVVSEERLASAPKLVEQAVEAGIDLLVVDEAHHLRRRPGRPGNAAYRAVAPIAEAGRHMLLLTAVPLEDDAHGFFRLLQLLRPAELPDAETFEARLASGEPLPPCTSATRRKDIGGLPPRRPAPVDFEAGEGWQARERWIEAVRRRPAGDALALRDKAAAVREALGSLLDPQKRRPASEEKDETTRLALEASTEDPRVAWLAEQMGAWQLAGEKVLVFVAERDSLEALRAALGRRMSSRIGLFHEGLSSKQRDIEVAQFRLPAGPSMLISTECGGEGRNFEFCHRLVLFDLPWSPMVVEQRIGRLDRIGRSIPVEVVYFRPPGGLGKTVVRLYEELGLFEHPLSSIETELRSVEEAIEDLALLAVPAGGVGSDASLEAERFEEILSAARQAYDRVERAAYHELHRDPYRPEMAEEILGRVPDGLEELTRDVVVGTCRQLGLHVEEHQAGRRHWIELDARARIESLPGIPGEASFLGTFFRDEGVEDETIEFFASGHPLVEGILAHLEESPLGRVALMRLPGEEGERGFGLLAVYRQGTEYEALVVDARGRERPEWRDRLLRRPAETLRVRAKEWVERPEWSKVVRTLGSYVEGRGEPVALAVFRVE